MKKFWNLMLAALVIFGAVACTENQEENIPEAKKEPVLSFVANIDVDDETRTILEQEGGQWTTNWTGADKLYVYAGDSTRYEFVNSSDNKDVFECYDDGVEELRGKNVTIDNGADFDSTKGVNGGSLYGDGVNFPYEPVTLSADNAFFRLSSVFEGELTASEPVFAYNGELHETVTLRPGEDVYVAFMPFTGTLKYSINGVVQKELPAEKEFAAKKIYPLGNVVTSELKVADFGIVGGHQGWDTAKKDAMYLIPGSNTYVRYNVKLADGFKFYGETSKTVTIEHPEVTGGETGYLFLKPNSNWTQANARFAAYFFGNGTEWVSMTDSNKDGIYAVQKPSKNYPNVIFCRMNPSASANNWDNKWNQTGDLKIPTDGNNLFTVPSGSWDGSTTSWSKHTPVEHQDAWTETKEEITTYWLGKEDTDKDISKWVTRWSNNGGSKNITVSDTNKTYDIYFSREADQDWGFVYYFAVKESNSEAPKLK